MRSFRLLAGVLAFSLFSRALFAAPVQVTSFDNTSQFGTAAAPPFAPSSTDLVNQGQPSFLSITDGIIGDPSTGTPFTPYLGGVSSNLNNGNLGLASTNSTITFDLDGSWTNTFNLNTATNIAGYDITGITSYAGWTTGAYGQVYNIEISKVGDSSFIPLTSVNFSPATGTGNNSTRVAITDGTGILATNVDAIRFNFTAGHAYREIDVFGSASYFAPPLTPEPGSVLLMGVGLVATGFCVYRMRRA